MSPVFRLPPPWSSDGKHTAWSVWLTGDRKVSVQLDEHGYVPGSESDTRGVPPDIAAYAIHRYSRSGALVVDPDCGAGTVLVEALRADRHVVGITGDPRWWRVARANVSATKRRGMWHDGTVADRGSESPTSVRSVGLAHRADLVLTAIRRPIQATSPGLDWDCVGVWSALLRPGGYAVAVVRTHRGPDGELVDLADSLSAMSAANGLVVVDRCVALAARIRGGRVSPRASAVERVAVDNARAEGVPIAVVAHRTVLVLRAAHGVSVAGGVPADPHGRFVRDERAYG